MLSLLIKFLNMTFLLPRKILVGLQYDFAIQSFLNHEQRFQYAAMRTCVDSVSVIFKNLLESHSFGIGKLLAVCTSGL